MANLAQHLGDDLRHRDSHVPFDVPSVNLPHAWTGESTQAVTMIVKTRYAPRSTLFYTDICFPDRERTVTVRVAGIGVYVVIIHEGKSEGTIVPVHCVKAYGRVEACACLLYGTKSRVVIGLFTGRKTLRRQLLLMGPTNTPSCRRCGAEEEPQPTFCVSVKVWLHSLSSFFLDPEDIKCLSLGVI